jgi:hypothetical protein
MTGRGVDSPVEAHDRHISRRLRLGPASSRASRRQRVETTGAGDIEGTNADVRMI